MVQRHVKHIHILIAQKIFVSILDFIFVDSSDRSQHDVAGFSREPYGTEASAIFPIYLVEGAATVQPWQWPGGPWKAERSIVIPNDVCMHH